jgi:hypothetical protein
MGQGREAESIVLLHFLKVRFGVPTIRWTYRNAQHLASCSIILGHR